MSLDTDAATVRAFITAGNAVFTLSSRKTDRRFTYRIVSMPDGTPDRWFVSLLHAPSQYNYLGLLCRLYAPPHPFDLRLTQASCAGRDAPSVLAFAWMLGRINTDRDLVDADIDPMGRCARCARPLTVPESARTGLGPECVKKL